MVHVIISIRMGDVNAYVPSRHLLYCSEKPCMQYLNKKVKSVISETIDFTGY